MRLEYEALSLGDLDRTYLGLQLSLLLNFSGDVAKFVAQL